MSKPTRTDDERPLTRPDAVSLRVAFWFWLKLGFISFGGPAGQISIMHQELVERRRWISERRFLHALNYCMLLPGPEAQQLATYLGWLMHRGWGGIIAGALFVLPSLFILIALSWLYVAFGEVPIVAGIFLRHQASGNGNRGACRPPDRLPRTQEQLAVGDRRGVVRRDIRLQRALPADRAGCRRHRLPGRSLGTGKKFSLGGHDDKHQSFGPALIDDDTPPPDHVRFSAFRLARLVIIGALLWALPMGLLTAVFGWEGTLTQMAWFFTKAALLTFGGAYAVLPYVYQGAVGHFGWLTPTQMIDGLALGETTPGPLIMVVAFVGFVGGYVMQVFGPEQAFLAGAVAATLVTWFTFLPSFLFILAGGPLVESTHNALKFTAPLTAITAAVVGVILNLACFFGYHVLWPNGFCRCPGLAVGNHRNRSGHCAVSLQAGGVIQVLLACGLAGLAVHLLR
nr:chromate efflux transporter [Pseudomonas brassicacearum subsp. brassicacearum]